MSSPPECSRANSPKTWTVAPEMGFDGARAGTKAPSVGQLTTYVIGGTVITCETRGRGRRRSLVVVLLGAAALVVLPAAVAFACLPKAAIGFDKPGYEYKAGDTVTVKGYQLTPRSPVVMTLQAPSGELRTVGSEGTTTDDTGAFTDSFALPSNAATGDYVVNAKAGVRSASQSFSVAVAPAPSGAPAPPARPVLAPKLGGPALGMSFVKGTSGNDTLTGTPFADVITCGEGNDIVRGLGGNDRISCGGGHDRVDGGGGNDKVTGGSGNDTLRGGAGRDALRGGRGRDRLFGGSGADRLYRDKKDGTVSGGPGRDSRVSVR